MASRKYQVNKIDGGRGVNDPNFTYSGARTLSPYTLTFPAGLEDEYNEHIFAERVRHVRFTIVMGTIIWLLFIIYDVVVPSEASLLALLLVRVVSLVYLIGAVAATYYARASAVMNGVLAFGIFLAGIGVAVGRAIRVDGSPTIGMIILIAVPHLLIQLKFVYLMTSTFAVIMIFFIVTLIGGFDSISSILAMVVYVTAVNIVGVTASYFVEFFNRNEYLHGLAIKAEQRKRKLEQQRVERLLLALLPSSIVARLKDDNMMGATVSGINDHFSNVTILFANVVNYSKMAQSMDPQEMLTTLNEIFASFDKLNEKYGMEKIKTIGDTYMTVAGLPTPCHDHAEKAARMAVEMLKVIRSVGKRLKRDLNLRIGINSGAATAGVIGVKKFCYDLWGDAVNIAARMEQHGTVGRIQVHESTYELLKNDFVFEDGGFIEVKGKKEALHTYFLLDFPDFDQSPILPSQLSRLEDIRGVSRPNSFRENAHSGNKNSYREGAKNSYREGSRLSYREGQMGGGPRPFKPSQELESALEAVGELSRRSSFVLPASTGPGTPNDPAAIAEHIQALIRKDNDPYRNKVDTHRSVTGLPQLVRSPTNQSNRMFNQTAVALNRTSVIDTSDGAEGEVETLVKSLNNFTLYFPRRSGIEAEYDRGYFSENLKHLRVALGITVLYLLWFSILDALVEGNWSENIEMVVIRFGVLVPIFLLSLLATFVPFIQSILVRSHQVVTIFLSVLLLTLVLVAGAFSEAPTYIIPRWVAALVLVSTYGNLKIPSSMAVYIIAMVIHIVLAYAWSPILRESYLYALAYTIIVVLMGMAARYRTNIVSRRDFLLKRQVARHKAEVAEEKAKAESLLVNILPEAVAQRLVDQSVLENDTIPAIAESFPAVTVLLADVIDFTSIAMRLTPDRIVEVLNACFTAFDLIAAEHGLEKIKTIGDAYLCVGGLPNPVPDHAERVVDMGLAMQRAMKEISTRFGQDISIRIGVHSGPAIAGVVGRTKFIYDLWGDTVTFTAALEAAGAPDTVLISEEVRRQLPDKKYQFLNGRHVDLSGGGSIKAYNVMPVHHFTAVEPLNSLGDEPSSDAVSSAPLTEEEDRRNVVSFSLGEASGGGGVGVGASAVTAAHPTPVQRRGRTASQSSLRGGSPFPIGGTATLVEDSEDNSSVNT